MVGRIVILVLLALGAGLGTERIDAQNDVSGALVTVRPLHTGVCQLGKNHVLGDRYSDNDRLTFVIYSFLVEGADGQKALIDFGPETTEYCNRMFVRYGLFRDLGPDRPPSERFPDQITQPHGNVFDQLRALEIAPSTIDHVIFSHLHADHHGMDDATDGGAAERFPNAVLHVSTAGWEDNLSRRRDGEWNSYVDYAFGDFLVRASQTGRTRFADDATVFRGVRTLYLGGHSVCSQAVLLDTAEGLAIVTSDEVYLYSLLEEGILPQIHTSEARYRVALDRLVRLAMEQNGILVAMHDPVVWELYKRLGSNWLKGLKTISDRAVAAYAHRRGWR